MDYENLTSFLACKKYNKIVMSFAEIETILGTPLPAAARRHRSWWNNSSRAQAAWRHAEFVARDVSLANQTVVFVRDNSNVSMHITQLIIDDPKVIAYAEGCADGMTQRSINEERWWDHYSDAILAAMQVAMKGMRP